FTHRGKWTESEWRRFRCVSIIVFPQQAGLRPAQQRDSRRRRVMECTRSSWGMRQSRHSIDRAATSIRPRIPAE
ncbi:hypothetical protein PFISCL1PPCAC_7312, partial [Pristionchus fissidentatus]